MSGYGDTMESCPRALCRPYRRLHNVAAGASAGRPNGRHGVRPLRLREMPPQVLEEALDVPLRLL